jgi:hypothetical protein
MPDVVSIIDGLDLVVALADGHVHPDDLALARSSAREARERRGHLGSTLVLALVGGTGSGKSSLLNALAGEAVASVSAIRPHTTRPLAWIPAGAEPSIHDLLGRLHIDDRIEQDRFPGLALLDMTDVDSVEVGHRTAVEALLPEVDGIIWVLDPIKYHDPVLHDEFIAPLADSADQFVFVLNQIDRLDVLEIPAVVDDLVTTLEGEGIVSPVVFAVAADPPGEGPIGVDALADHLRTRMDNKRVYLGRVLADTRRAARHLADAAGLRRGGSLDFEERWSDLIDATVTALSVFGPSPGVLEEAICGIEDFVGRLSAESGGPFGTRIRQAFTTERIERVLREGVNRMDLAVPRPEERRAKRRVVDPEERAAAAEVLAAELQRRIGGPLREIVWERASLAAYMAELAVDAVAAEDALQQRSGGAGPAVQ